MPRWLAILLYSLGLLTFGALARYVLHDRPPVLAALYLVALPVGGAYVYYSLEKERGTRGALHGKTRRQLVLDFCLMALVLGLIGMCWASVVRMTGE